MEQTIDTANCTHDMDTHGANIKKLNNTEILQQIQNEVKDTLKEINQDQKKIKTLIPMFILILVLLAAVSVLILNFSKFAH